MGATSVAGYIIGIVLAIYITAYTLPEAVVALTCSTSWSGAPTAVITLGTTVLSIIVILGIAIKFMPQEIKSKVGLWLPAPIPKISQVKTNTKRRIAQLAHFER